MTEDVNHDDRIDFEDRQAEWRAQDQAEQAQFWGGIFAAAFAAWASFTASIRAIPGLLRRVRIVARVQIVAESVTDAEALYDKLFPLPPNDAGHESYRRSFVALALEKKKTREQWLMFAEMLTGLEAYEERPLDAWLVLRRQPSPKLTAPAPQGLLSGPVQAQGLLGPLPGVGIPGLSWINMVLAAALVLSLGWGAWMRGDANKAHAWREANERLHDDNEALAERVRQSDAMAARAIEERNQLARQYDAQLTGARRVAESARARLAKERIEHAQAQAAGRAPLDDDRDWLRQLAGTSGDGDGSAPGAIGETGSDPHGVPGGSDIGTDQPRSQ